mgnify:FL=1
MAALRQGQLLAPMIFTGPCDSAVFTAWLERFLRPALQPGQIVFLDNARFHQAPTMTPLLARVGGSVRYRPPDSPDFNPIEHHWASLKNRIRKNIPHAPSFFMAVCDAFNQ